TAMVRNGTFREDLYFRLSILPLAIPALRERKEDVVPLINHFLKKYNQIHNMKKTFTQEVYDRLIRYSLPGNVRELMNIVEQLVVMSENQAVTFDELPHSLRVEDPSLSIAGDLNNFKLTRADIEKKLIEEALKKHKTLQQVAQFLGVNQSTVSRKIHQYNIKRT
ncbi:MAG: helix-turn-helix domain-containing protein, partial [Pseudomonadota bacterium]